MRLSTVTSLTVLIGTILALAPAASAGDAPASFTVVRTMDVGGEGRWDALTTDAAGKRLFVPRQSHTQILDAQTGTVLGDIPKTDGVHGVALVEALNRGFTSNGKGASVTVFDLTSYKTLGSIAAADDADCIIADPASKKVLVFCGDAGVVVPIPFDADPTASTTYPSLNLGGKPEFAIADGKGHCYVNIADKDEVAVIDTAQMKITARYSLAPGKEPTGIALDATTGRLFVGCHNQMLVIMDATSGKVLASPPIGKGVDGTDFHAGYAFASCGDGTMTVIHEDSPTAFSVAQTVKTAPGARTLTIDQASGTVYLPTATMGPAPAATADHPHPRPTPVPGTFKIVVVAEQPTH